MRGLKMGSPRGASKERTSKEAPGRKAEEAKLSAKTKSQKEAPGLRAKDVAASKKDSSKKAATPKAATPKAATPKAATPKAATPKAATPKASTPKAAKETSTRGERSTSKEKTRGHSKEKRSKPSTPRSESADKAASTHSRTAGKSSHPRTAGASAQPLLPGGESTPRRSTEKPQPTSTPKYGAPKTTYLPPPALSSDSIDDIIQKVDQHGDDKYHLFAGTGESRSVTKPDHHQAFTQPVRKQTPRPSTIQPPAVRQNSGPLLLPVSEMTSQSFEGTEASNYSDLQPPSQTKLARREIASISTLDSERFLNGDAIWSDDDEYVVVKQRIAFLCIAVSALQLAILLIQLILCGVASVDVNPMIGPFPDAFSEWGGKNVYLMLEGRQYFRIISPIFLHVGVLHLLVNVFCQLETCAFFEREWGSGRWLALYIISGLGSVATSSVVTPDLIGVCSSGALMGLFGAKIAQVISWTAFELQTSAYYDSVQLDQLGGVMCSAALVSIMSLFTYIDWSGHMGGLAAGFLGGMLIFCKPIESTCIRILWGGTGLLGLLGGACLLGYILLYETFPDEDLADACSYFRNLFPEGYDCECVWN
jgi:membrane associated rhomboid family serine protease